MNAFEREFGGIVYDKELSILPTVSIIKGIYNILNRTLFNNKLSMPEIICGTSGQISGILISLGNTKYTPDIISRFYAIYMPMAKIVGMPFNAKFEFESERIFVNISNGKMTFAFLASSVCHEMIHQYDAHFGDVAKIYKNQELTGQEVDIHTTAVFMKKMELANRNMLTVIPNGSGMSFAELNEYMANRVNGINESDKPSEEEIRAVLAANGAVKRPDGYYVIVFGN